MLAMVEASGHHDYVLPGGVRGPQDIAQIIEIPGVANSNQNVSRPYAQGSRTKFLVSVDPKLIEILRLAVPGFGDDMLGVGKNSEENRAEYHSGNRGFGFGEQIYQRCG